MKLHELRPAEGAVSSKKRLGRGTATGQGKTSGRGQKGQKSRSGGGVRVGFEGGQMPLYRRLPKRGFKNPFKKVYTLVNVETLNRFENGTEITAEVLKSTGAISKIATNVFQNVLSKLLSDFLTCLVRILSSLFITLNSYT